MPTRQIDIVPITKPAVQYLIWHDSGKELAGYCLITADIKRLSLIKQVQAIPDIKEATLWHIYVKEELRRKAYATNLIYALRHSYDLIITQALGNVSRKFLLSCGFKKGEFDIKGGLELFIWEKEYGNNNVHK